MKKFTDLALAFAFLAMVAPASAQEGHYLYKTSLVQAAPGKILEVIDIYRSLSEGQARAGVDEPLLWMRHSQGDRWDLLILFPMKSYSEYYAAERVAKREKGADANLNTRLKQDIAWQEDVFAYGPSLDDVKKAFAGAGLFHVEMFQALPGKDAELFKQREMENTFSGKLGEPQNLIFVRDQGAAWDVFTIGCFRNMKHYAESEGVSKADQEAAAKAAGFESPAQIGPYLRTLISLHHDTLATAIK